MTLVCPTSVVDQIRSWKADICQRKISITFHTFAESLDTAEALYLFKDKVVDDFVVIVGSVLFEAAAILQALDEHRTREPVVTCIMQEASDVNTVPMSLKQSLNDTQRAASFVGHAADGRLVYVRANSSVAMATLGSGKLAIKKGILRRFPDMLLTTRLFDSQVYVFSKSALDLAEDKRRNITSIHQHLIPYLVRSQFRSQPYKVGIQSLANSMSSSATRLAPELRCFMSLIPASVFLSRIQSLEDYVHVSRAVAGETVTSMAPPGSRSEVKRIVIFKEAGVQVHEKAMIGTGCIIGGGSVIEGPCSCKKSTLGQHTRLMPNVKIQTSLMLDHVTVCEGAVVKNSIVGSNVIIESNCIVENAVIGFGMKTEKGKSYSNASFIAQ